MDAQRATLAVVIPTKDAAPLLREALASVAFADEIIVVDMFSTDETQAVCDEHPQCRLLRRDDYIFGNVNFGFESATADWVMRLDTDERVTPELAAEISEILARPPAGAMGYEFLERRMSLGRELRHGAGRPHYRRMLFRRGSARYPVRHEHEELEGLGPWRRAEHGYLHYSYASIGDYLRKIDYYTEKDVERVDLPGRPPSVRRALLETVRAFYLYAIRLRGYRDGWIGWLDAGMRAFYQFTYWMRLRERWERERG
ncbi:MAG: glycosyltransferase family 2 protein [Solirubrobacteraceae bacterium]